MENKNKQPPVLDFFGNEIEVGDEVAYPTGKDDLSTGIVSRIDTSLVYFKIQVDSYAYHHPRSLIVNTEKKHREKALDYLVQEAQEMGMYEDGVGVNTTKDGYE